jgi:phage terminase small subunit
MNPTKPLTAKQAEFVRHVVSGCSLADSYRLAYNSSGTSGTVRVEASRLAKQPHILYFEKG